MKGVLKDLILSIFMGLILPGILMNATQYLLEQRTELQTVTENILVAEQESNPITLRNPDGRKTQMRMEDYLRGVLLAEIPVSFHPEAIKAQAIAARTYARKAEETGGRHGDGSLCTKASCCQGYITDAEYLKNGGTEYGIDAIRTAIVATTGCVVMFQGELIESLYYSCSGGRTEAAVAVWGTDYPYLCAVDSPGEEKADVYTDTMEMTFREFCNSIGLSLSGDPSDWFGPVTYTQGGGVDTMVIGDEKYTGLQLRSLLGLPSTAFTVTVGDAIIISSKGYGHRVGLSQYGADAMAKSGSSYDEILSYYYPGTYLSFREID